MRVHGTTTRFRKQRSRQRSNSKKDGVKQKSNKLKKPLPSKFAKMAEDERKSLILGLFVSEGSMVRKSSRIAMKKNKIEAVPKKREETALNDTKYFQKNKKGTKLLADSYRSSFNSIPVKKEEDATYASFRASGNHVYNLRERRSYKFKDYSNIKTNNIKQEIKFEDEDIESMVQTEVLDDEEDTPVKKRKQFGKHDANIEVHQDSIKYFKQSSSEDSVHCQVRRSPRTPKLRYCKDCNNHFGTASYHPRGNSVKPFKNLFSFAIKNKKIKQEVEQDSHHDFELSSTTDSEYGKLRRSTRTPKPTYPILSFKNNKMKQEHQIVTDDEDRKCMVKAEVLDDEEDEPFQNQLGKRNRKQLSTHETKTELEQYAEELFKLPFSEDSEYGKLRRSPRTPKLRYDNVSSEKNKIVQDHKLVSKEKDEPVNDELGRKKQIQIKLEPKSEWEQNSAQDFELSFTTDTEYGTLRRSPRIPKPRYENLFFKNNNIKEKHIVVSEKQDMVKSEVLNDEKNEPVDNQLGKKKQKQLSKLEPKTQLEQYTDGLFKLPSSEDSEYDELHQSPKTSKHSYDNVSLKNNKEEEEYQVVSEDKVMMMAEVLDVEKADPVNNEIATKKQKQLSKSRPKTEWEDSKHDELHQSPKTSKRSYDNVPLKNKKEKHEHQVVSEDTVMMKTEVPDAEQDNPHNNELGRKKQKQLSNVRPKTEWEKYSAELFKLPSSEDSEHDELHQSPKTSKRDYNKVSLKNNKVKQEHQVVSQDKIMMKSDVPDVEQDDPVNNELVTKKQKQLSKVRPKTEWERYSAELFNLPSSEDSEHDELHQSPNTSKRDNIKQEHQVISEGQDIVKVEVREEEEIDFVNNQIDTRKQKQLSKLKPKTEWQMYVDGLFKPSSSEDSENDPQRPSPKTSKRRCDNVSFKNNEEPDMVMVEVSEDKGDEVVNNQFDRNNIEYMVQVDPVHNQLGKKQKQLSKLKTRTELEQYADDLFKLPPNEDSEHGHLRPTPKTSKPLYDIVSLENNKVKQEPKVVKEEKVMVKTEVLDDEGDELSQFKTKTELEQVADDLFKLPFSEDSGHDELRRFPKATKPPYDNVSLKNNKIKQEQVVCEKQEMVMVEDPEDSEIEFGGNNMEYMVKVQDQNDEEHEPFMKEMNSDTESDEEGEVYKNLILESIIPRYMSYYEHYESLLVYALLNSMRMRVYNLGNNDEDE